MPIKTIEGVDYYRFVVYYTLLPSGTRDRQTRRRMVRLSPGFPWVREEVCRELCERFGYEAIKPGSVSIKHLKP